MQCSSAFVVRLILPLVIRQFGSDYDEESRPSLVANVIGV